MATEVLWKTRLEEAAERIRSRYQHIGRKTGASILVLLYPPQEEPKVLREWRAIVEGLAPEFDGHHVDALEVTQAAMAEIGMDDIVFSLDQPMPGCDPHDALRRLWINALTKRIREALPTGGSRAFVSLERLAALHQGRARRARADVHPWRLEPVRVSRRCSAGSDGGGGEAGAHPGHERGGPGEHPVGVAGQDAAGVLLRAFAGGL